VPFIPKERNILLGCGSLDLLFNLNLLCLTRGQKVLGHAPQFNVYVDNVRFGGSVYECYCMRREAGNFLFEADRYIEQMREEHRLFIVENPNNPTGQVIPLADIARIAARARALGRILVVDEAYGTYMGMDNSAIRLLGSYPNVVVTRTFSKGMGMAGMRMGYCVGGSDKYGGGASGEDSVLFQLSKLVNSFACNGLARALALAMLRTDPASLDSYLALGQIAHNKRALRQIFEGGSDGMGGSGSDGSSSGGSGLRRLRALRMAATSDETPILTVYVDEPSAAMRADAGWSLQSFLAQSVGLGTVSCATYLGLDRFAIRIMLPSDAGQVALLSDMLARADEMLAEGALS
jgi:histidinol-phosphate aminotransferase